MHFICGKPNEKSKNEKKMKKTLVLFTLALFVSNMGLVAENIGSEWFCKIPEFFSLDKQEENEFSVPIILYYQILLSQNNIGGAFSIFRLNDFEVEKYEFIKYTLFKHFSTVIPSSAQLKTIFREISKLRSVESLFFDMYFEVFQLAFKIGDIELAKKAFQVAKGYETIEGLERLCIDIASRKARLYKMARLLGFKDEARRIFEDMERFPYYCPSKLKNHTQYNLDVIRSGIFSAYIDIFLELKDSGNCSKYFKKSEAIIANYPDTVPIIPGLRLFEDYFNIGDTEKAGEMLDSVASQVVEYCNQYDLESLPQQKGQFIHDALHFFLKFTDDPAFYSLKDPNYFLKKLKCVNRFSDYAFSQSYTKLFVRVNIHQRQYSIALEALRQFKSEWKDKGQKLFEGLLLDLILDRQKNDSQFDYKNFEYGFSDPYFNLALDYFYAKFLLKQSKCSEARVFIERALDRLNHYNRKNIVRPKGINYASIGELYWKLNDEEGLRKALDWVVRRKDKVSYYIEGIVQELSKWLVDIYLSKGKFEKAWEIIDKTDDSDLKCVGLIYAARYYEKIGEIQKAKAFLNRTFDFFKKKKIDDYELIFIEFYRMFILRPTQKSSLERIRFIELWESEGLSE